MKVRMLVIVLALASTSSMCGLSSAQLAGNLSPSTHVAKNAGVVPSSGTHTSPPTKVDFVTEVKPIMQARCQPCHFQGGNMYSKLPFDRPETIKSLGERLFTRIKAENDRKVIRDFLSQ